MGTSSIVFDTSYLSSSYQYNLDAQLRQLEELKEARKAQEEARKKREITQKKQKTEILKDTANTERKLVGDLKKHKKDLKTDLKNQTKTDNKKFGFWDGLKAFGKGAARIAGSMVGDYDKDGKWKFNLGKAAISAVIAIGAIALEATPVGWIVTAAGVIGGLAAGAELVKGISDASKAKTFNAKDAAWQEIGEGGTGVIASVVGEAFALISKASKAEKLAGALKTATEEIAGLADDSKDAKALAAIKAQAENLDYFKYNPFKVKKALNRITKLTKTDGVQDSRITGLFTHDEVAPALKGFNIPKASNFRFKDKGNIIESIKAIVKGGDEAKSNALSEALTEILGKKGKAFKLDGADAKLTEIQDAIKNKNFENLSKILQEIKDNGKINDTYGAGSKSVINALQEALESKNNYYTELNNIIKTLKSAKNKGEVITALGKLKTMVKDDEILLELVKSNEESLKPNLGEIVTTATRKTGQGLKTVGHSFTSDAAPLHEQIFQRIRYPYNIYAPFNRIGDMGLEDARQQYIVDLNDSIKATDNALEAEQDKLTGYETDLANIWGVDTTGKTSKEIQEEIQKAQEEVA